MMDEIHVFCDSGRIIRPIFRLREENGKKTKEDTKEYHQLQKYLGALDVEMGVLINFPFPPENEPEIIQ